MKPGQITAMAARAPIWASKNMTSNRTIPRALPYPCHLAEALTRRPYQAAAGPMEKHRSAGLHEASHEETGVEGLDAVHGIGWPFLALTLPNAHRRCSGSDVLLWHLVLDCTFYPLDSMRPTPGHDPNHGPLPPKPQGARDR